MFPPAHLVDWIRGIGSPYLALLGQPSFRQKILLRGFLPPPYCGLNL